MEVGLSGGFLASDMDELFLELLLCFLAVPGNILHAVLDGAHSVGAMLMSTIHAVYAQEAFFI